MTQPVITDQDVEKGIQEAQAMVKIMKIVKQVAPAKRFAVMEACRALIEAESSRA